MKQVRRIAPGILLCLAIATPAWQLGKAYPIIGGPVFGILSGMVLALCFPKLPSFALATGKPLPGKKDAVALPQETLRFEDGIKYTSKKLLQYSIILLGFEMNLYNVLKVGGQSLFVMLFTLTASFLTAYVMGKALHLDGKMTTLIGVGTSICGGSAIAATAPVIQAKDEDVAHAISTIFLFNIIAVFIFPPLGRSLGMSDIGFGMWAGTAINDTSSVVAAGASWSAAVGNNTALAFATVVKLTRTLMIVSITLVLAIYTTRKNKAASSASAPGQTAKIYAAPGNTSSGQAVTAASQFSFVKVFPWFVIGFVVAAVANTFAGIPATTSATLVTIGKFVIVMAMSAIGLNTNLKRLLTNGFKPIFLGLSCWFAVACVSLLVQVVMKTW
jgi:uncharacterized membrane protein YadS